VPSLAEASDFRSASPLWQTRDSSCRFSTKNGAGDGESTVRVCAAASAVALAPAGTATPVKGEALFGSAT
jgi:hypothetical protein